jgi:hypothetical protein
MGRDLICKLRAQIMFDSNGTVVIKLRGTKTKTNFHSSTRRMVAAFH